MKNKGEILATHLKSFNDCYFFLHNTREHEIVEKIMNEGFIFESQLSHSTDRINPGEPVEIAYFFFQRKDYGNYTIIIAINRELYDSYTETAARTEMEVEELLTITNPYYGDNDELIYQLSPKYILGYFNIKTSEFFKNSKWDPFFKKMADEAQQRHPGIKKGTGSPHRSR